jgi:hypothetical protein
MKTFIYVYSETKAPSDNSGRKKTVRVWRVVKNKPVWVGERTETYCSEYELVMNCLQYYKALPAEAFERVPPSNTRKYKSEASLREAGIADLHSL